MEAGRAEGGLQVSGGQSLAFLQQLYIATGGPGADITRLGARLFRVHDLIMDVLVASPTTRLSLYLCVHHVAK